MVAMILLAFCPRLQPGEHCVHYSHGGTRVRSVAHIQDALSLAADKSVDWMHKHLRFSLLSSAWTNGKDWM